MAEEKLLTVRDVATILSISEKEVLDLAEAGTIPAYKIGGVYLRFKKEQITGYAKHVHPVLSKPKISENYPFKDKINDFIYFNDFYILTFIIVVLLLVLIFRGF